MANPKLLNLPTGPRSGFNRPGAEASEAHSRTGMAGGTRARYDCIKAVSETEFTEDLKAMTVPTLVMHGDDNQIVPYADSAPLSANLLTHGTLKTCKGLPHGMGTTDPDIIDADLLAFIDAAT